MVKRNDPIRASLRRFPAGATCVALFFACGASLVSAAGLAPESASLSAQVQSFQQARRAADHEAFNRWKLSLAPVFASQALDVASSYGMRELNPMLAGSDGRFGAKGTGIKLGTTAGLMGVEYMIVRKYPRAARVFTKVNWSVSIVTAGFAVHNFAIR